MHHIGTIIFHFLNSTLFTPTGRRRVFLSKVHVCTVYYSSVPVDIFSVVSRCFEEMKHKSSRDVCTRAEQMLC